MLNPRDLRHHIVRPTLYGLACYTLAAEELVMVTAANATGCARLVWPGGRLVAQGTTPTDDEPVGLWGITPAQHQTLLDWLGEQPPELRALLCDASGVAHPSEDHLLGNLRYGAAVCRLWYLRAEREAGLVIPDPTDLRGIAQAWVKHWLRDTADEDAVIAVAQAQRQAAAAVL